MQESVEINESVEIDETNKASWSITGIFGGTITGDESDIEPIYISVGGSNCINGCTIPTACNYNPNANILVIEECNFSDCAGCTYPDAINYNDTASIDDGTCMFEIANPCPADLNGDGAVTTADLLVFLSSYGKICE